MTDKKGVILVGVAFVAASTIGFATGFVIGGIINEALSS